MKKVIVIGLAALVAGAGLVVGIAATKPDEFQVQRSLTINASPERILSHLSDFRKWAAWSPWEKLDPNLKRQFSGPESGQGAKYAWVGNGNVGAGDMEILVANPSLVEIKLHFEKPFEATNRTVFTIQSEGEATRVTWTMTGDSP